MTTLVGDSVYYYNTVMSTSQGHENGSGPYAAIVVSVNNDASNSLELAVFLHPRNDGTTIVVKQKVPAQAQKGNSTQYWTVRS